MEFKREDLEHMKRAELQKLCKTHGVKANMKTAKLIEGLLEISAKAHSTVESTVQDENIPEAVTIEKELPIEEDKTKSPERNVVEEKESQNDNKEQLTIPDKVKDEVAQPAKKIQLSKAASSKIPRLTNGVKSNKKVVCTTPKTNQSKTPKNTGSKDWSTIHQRQFDKMDSLGDYLEKKRKRAADLSSSVKKVKLSGDANSTAKKPVKIQTTSKSFVTKTPKQQQVNPTDKKKRLTFNFTKSTKENLTTPGKLKRPATLGAIKTPTHTTQHKPATPFRFSAATNTSATGPGLFSPTPRKVFDLKTSLAKPLSYKPYTGKLPTPTYAKQNANKTSSAKKNISHERDVKAVKLTSRQERREKQKTNVSKNRKDAMCKRRGVVC